jgi:uncharacterized protein (TIGR02996 family)
MEINELLNQLDASLDDVERLVGADWLEENGCLDEASFYRWVIANHLKPAFTSNTSYYHWLRNKEMLKRLNGTGLYLFSAYHCIIEQEAVFNLMLRNVNNDIKSFTSHSQAMTALRRAYQRAFHATRSNPESTGC